MGNLETGELMDTPGSPRLKVIGVGNEWRGDDAAGLLVVRRLQHDHLPQVEISESPGTGNAIQDAWQDAAGVIVVDAIVSGGPPGAIFRFDMCDPGATFPVSHSSSSHGWGLSEALALGKVFQNLPPYLIIYGIEGKNFGPGREVSLEVEAAIPEVAQRIKLEIQEWLEREGPKPGSR